MRASFSCFITNLSKTDPFFSPSNRDSYQICDCRFGSLICQILQRLSYFILSCIHVQNNPYKYVDCLFVAVLFTVM